MPKSKNPWGLYDPRAPWDISDRLQYNTSQRSTWTEPNGNVVWNDIVEVRHASKRPFYGKSPVYVIPGTSSVGRRPTDYSRVIYTQVTNQMLHFERTSDGMPNGNVIRTPLNTGTMSVNLGSKLPRLEESFCIDGNYPDWADIHFRNILDRATTECLVKLGMGKIDAGTALAELAKTTRHLASTATDLWRSVSALKGKRWGELLNILSKRSPLHSRKIAPGKTAAQYWLEYNYAWKPLLLEAHGLVELVKLQLKPAMLVHANRTVSRSIDVNTSFGDGLWYQPLYKLHGKVRQEATCRLTGAINSTGMRLAVAAGLTNPAAVLWELVPYSFVVDWSLPIGNYLEACQATRGLTFVWGSKTQRTMSHLHATASGRGQMIQYSEGQGELMKFGIRRYALTAFPRPVLYSKSPFSSSHVGSALALFRQLI